MTIIFANASGFPRVDAVVYLGDNPALSDGLMILKVVFWDLGLKHNWQDNLQHNSADK